MGRDQGSRARETTASLLGRGDLHSPPTFIPLPTSSLPADLGLLSCQKRRFMENSLLFTPISWEEGERMSINSHKLGRGKFQLYFPLAVQGKGFPL